MLNVIQYLKICEFFCNEKKIRLKNAFKFLKPTLRKNQSNIRGQFRTSAGLGGTRVVP